MRSGMKPATAQSNLADFLLARIADDEAVAERDCTEIMKFGSGEVLRRVFSPWALRMFHEVEAKRAIVEEHASFVNPWAGPDDERPYCRVCVAPSGWPVSHEPLVGVVAPCTTLRAVASVYADHPDYLDEWRP